MGDYWSLMETYEKDKKKDTKGKDKKNKKDKKKNKGSKGFEKATKKITLQYGEFLKTRLTGIFEAKVMINGKKKKVYIFRTSDMRYPEVFMDLEGQSFKDWIIDQLGNKNVNPNKPMYAAEITLIDIPDSLFDILKNTNTICKAYAAGMANSPVPVEDEELDELIEKADTVVADIQDNMD